MVGLNSIEFENRLVLRKKLSLAYRNSTQLNTTTNTSQYNTTKHND